MACVAAEFSHMASGNLASQARHELDSPQETFASRNVVRELGGTGRGSGWRARTWEKGPNPNLQAPRKHQAESSNGNRGRDFQLRTPGNHANVVNSLRAAIFRHEGHEEHEGGGGSNKGPIPPTSWRSGRQRGGTHSGWVAGRHPNPQPGTATLRQWTALPQSAYASG
jgi:hypothetical protein